MRRSRPSGGVWIDWKPVDGCLQLTVEDEGPGLAGYLEPVRPVLHDEAHRVGHRPRAEPPDSRSARRHRLALENRGDARGCRAVLRPAHGATELDSESGR